MERWEQEAHLAQASNSPPAAARERWRDGGAATGVAAEREGVQRRRQ